MKKNREPKQLISGTLIANNSSGTLLIGDAGVGKTSIALDLYENGFRLISDDVVDIYKSVEGIKGRSTIHNTNCVDLKPYGIIPADRWTDKKRSLEGVRIDRILYVSSNDDFDMWYKHHHSHLVEAMVSQSLISFIPSRPKD
jgi:HPr kinase/phosphorylase